MSDEREDLFRGHGDTDYYYTQSPQAQIVGTLARLTKERDEAREEIKRLRRQMRILAREARVQVTTLDRASENLRQIFSALGREAMTEEASGE